MTTFPKSFEDRVSDAESSLRHDLLAAMQHWNLTSPMGEFWRDGECVLSELDVADQEYRMRVTLTLKDLAWSTDRRELADHLQLLVDELRKETA